MFLIGIWHGASWTFVFYALLQANAMVLHRFFYRRSGRTANTVDPWALHAFKVFCALQFVVFSRILFRATGWENAFEVGKRLFSSTYTVLQISGGVAAVLIISFVLHYLPKNWFESIKQRFINAPAIVQGFALAIVGGLLALIATSETVPYIYFQF
ncbi:MAG: hypothetical protein R3A47_09185 [Polyangiales bacterium]